MQLISCAVVLLRLFSIISFTPSKVPPDIIPLDLGVNGFFGLVGGMRINFHLTLQSIVPLPNSLFPRDLVYFDILVTTVEVEMGSASKWKETLAERTASRLTVNLMQLVYGRSASDSATMPNKGQGSSGEESDDEEFFKPKGEGQKVCQHIVYFSFSLCLSFYIYTSPSVI